MLAKGLVPAHQVNRNGDFMSSAYFPLLPMPRFHGPLHAFSFFSPSFNGGLAPPPTRSHTKMPSFAYLCGLTFTVPVLTNLSASVGSRANHMSPPTEQPLAQSDWRSLFARHRPRRFRKSKPQRWTAQSVLFGIFFRGVIRTGGNAHENFHLGALDRWHLRGSATRASVC